MRIEQQINQLNRIQLPVTTPDRKKHNDLFPESIRCILAGPSNSGKTDLMLTLLLHRNGLKFKNVYICAKTINQEKYKLVGDILRNTPEIGYTALPDVTDLKLSDIKPDSVVIFDDVITSPQNTVIRDVFSFGRHKRIDVFFLVQTLSKVGKHLIRDNATIFILFRQDMRNLKNFYNDNISTDITFSKFLEMCLYCWEKPHGYIIINLDCKKNNGRYRETFDRFIIL